MRLERLPTGTRREWPARPGHQRTLHGRREPGINLNELWVYYNAYKDVTADRGYKYTTSGTLDAKRLIC